MKAFIIVTTFSCCSQPFLSTTLTYWRLLATGVLPFNQKLQTSSVASATTNICLTLKLLAAFIGALSVQFQAINWIVLPGTVLPTSQLLHLLAPLFSFATVTYNPVPRNLADTPGSKGLLTWYIAFILQLYRWQLLNRSLNYFKVSYTWQIFYCSQQALEHFANAGMWVGFSWIKNCSTEPHPLVCNPDDNYSSEVSLCPESDAAKAQIEVSFPGQRITSG